MAAGLGYIEFTTGDVLTAASANGYLASQVVMVFASAAARTSAIASPQEGMISYLKDTNSTEYYSGSAWVAIGGGGLSSPLTTKGDVWGYSTTNARIPVGSNGQVLTADSVEALGVKWATPAGGGGMTSIASGSLSGSALSITSISGSYKDLQLVLRGATVSAQADWRSKINNNGSGIYAQVKLVSAAGSFFSQALNNGTDFGMNYNNPAASSATTLVMTFPDYANTNGPKLINYYFTYTGHASSNEDAIYGLASAVDNNAITRYDLTLSTGNFTGGTYVLYGVN